jgi:hypothetical protein
LKKYIFFLFFALMGISCMAQPATINGKSINVVAQKTNPADGDILLGSVGGNWRIFTFGNMKKYYAPYVATTPVSYLPTPTGNALNKNTIFKSSVNGKIYFIDPYGSSICFDCTSGSGGAVLAGKGVYFLNGNKLNAVDADSTNELQTLLLRNNYLKLSRSNDSVNLGNLALPTQFRGTFDPAACNCLPPNNGATGSGVGGAIRRGDFWVISTAGNLPAGVLPSRVVVPGNLLYALQDNATTAAHYSTVASSQMYKQGRGVVISGDSIHANTLFNSNGILTSNRTVTGAFKTLHFINNNGLRFANAAQTVNNITFEVGSGAARVYIMKYQGALDSTQVSLKIGGYAGTRNDPGLPLSITSFGNQGELEKHSLADLKSALGIVGSGQIYGAEGLRKSNDTLLLGGTLSAPSAINSNRYFSTNNYQGLHFNKGVAEETLPLSFHSLTDANDSYQTHLTFIHNRGVGLGQVASQITHGFGGLSLFGNSGFMTQFGTVQTGLVTCQTGGGGVYSITASKGVKLANYNFFPDSLQLSNYPASRNDTSSVINFLSTRANGVLQSNPISEIKTALDIKALDVSITPIAGTTTNVSISSTNVQSAIEQIAQYLKSSILVQNGTYNPIFSNQSNFALGGLQGTYSKVNDIVNFSIKAIFTPTAGNSGITFSLPVPSDLQSIYELTATATVDGGGIASAHPNTTTDKLDVFVNPLPSGVGQGQYLSIVGQYIVR